MDCVLPENENEKQRLSVLLKFKYLPSHKRRSQTQSMSFLNMDFCYFGRCLMKAFENTFKEFEVDGNSL